MRALLAKLLQRAQSRAATLSESLDRQADDADAKLAQWRRRLSQDPDDVEANIDLGAALVARGEHGEAEPMLRRAIALAPGHPRTGSAHRALGVALGARGDREGAISNYRQAIELGAADEIVFRDLCVGYAQGGDMARAAEVAQRGLALFPDSADLHAIQGNILGMAGDFAGAAQCYQRALESGPPSAETHYNLGIVLGRLDRLDEAIANYRRACALDVSHAAARLNLANALRKKGQLAEALVHFAGATRIAPAYAEAHFGEGTARQQAGEPARALASLERALALAPADPRIPVAMGSVLQDLGRIDEAVQRLEDAVRLRPGYVDALVQLGNLLLQRGDQAQAIERYREALSHDPGNGVAHLVNALSGGDAERASEQYVAKLFDDYADRFESHLVEELRYESPRLVADMLVAHATAPGKRWEVLDLGCGTGLVGAAIAASARRIVGVDLSPNMLEKARASGHYDRLESADLLRMMAGEPDASYDVVTAADVLVYLGKLDDVAREAARLLRPGGFLAFSVESLDALPDAAGTDAHARGYRLNANARYAHAIAYLGRLAETCGFESVERREVILRYEKGTPVAGYILLWRLGGSSA